MCFFLSSFFAGAEEFSKDMSAYFDGWKDSAVVSHTPYDSLFNVVFIKDYTSMEWRKSSSFKGENLSFKTMFLYTTTHKRIKLNNDSGVDDFNKMYLPVLSNEEIFTIHARAINPDGTVINFDESSIKELEDLEGYGPYKIFVFEGVQVGSELEYFYTIKSIESDFYGTQVVQRQVPILDYGFEISAPLDYVFVCKSYNGIDSLNKEQLPDKINKWSIKNVMIKGFENEPFSAGDALKPRIEYKLLSDEKGGDDVYTWQKAANWYANYIYNSPDKAHEKWEKKAIKKLLKKIKFRDGLSKLDKISTIENYLKSEIELDQYSDVIYAHEILSKKRYSKLSSVRLFALILRQLEIDHEIVITSNRYKKLFDGEFESYTFLNHLMLYLPEDKVFLNPASDIHRMGVIPYGLSNQNGLFIKTIMIGPYVSAFPDIKFIPSDTYRNNYSNLDIKVELSEDMREVNAHYTKSALGHCATSTQPYLPFLSDKQRKNVLREFFSDLTLDAEVKEIAVENERYAVGKQNPFIISAAVTLNSLLEKAGDRYLFRLGDLIGQQSELYQNKKRKFDISNSFNRQYLRTIELKIPSGYKLLNPEEFTMTEALVVDGDTIAQFLCSYKLTDSFLQVNIDEFYGKINIDKKHYLPYRKVVNAAADFNKKVLILARE